MSPATAPPWIAAGPFLPPPQPFAITTDLPVVPADDPALPPPGPAFAAEAERMLPVVDTAAWDDRIRRWLDDAAAAGRLPAGLDDEDFRRQARSRSEKQRGLARKRALKLLQAEAKAARAGLVTATLTALYRRALYEPGFVLPVDVKGMAVPAEFVPGHPLAGPEGHPPYGPRPARVVVVGKYPGHEEARLQRNFVGPASGPWNRAVEELRLAGAVDDWYVTSLVKFPPCDPAGDRLAAAWVADCLPLVRSELALCRPDFVLFLGADAAKAVLGRPVKVAESRGEVLDLAIPPAPGGGPATTARAMVILHPAAAFKDPDQYDDFRDSLAEFVALTEGRPPRRPRIRHRRHVVLHKERELAAVVDRIVAETATGATIAVDCEWQGEWYKPGSWLRTIQFSHRPGEAYCVVLRHAGGRPAFKPTVAAPLPHLARLLKSAPSRRVRLGGHFFRADLPWLLQYGLDLRDEFAWDTAYAAHAINETGVPFELETLAVRYLGVPRYDRELHAEIERMCEEKGIKKSELGGYGDLADDVLHPYANWDVDVEGELHDLQEGGPGRPGLLDVDRHGLESRRAERITHGAAAAYLEIETRGMLVDRPRIDALVRVFADARARALDDLRAATAWPAFNPASADQVRELLFGEAHNGKRRRLRPEGAATLGLEPIKSTGKRGKAWDKVVARGDEDLFVPATDRETLGILKSLHPVAVEPGSAPMAAAAALLEAAGLGGWDLPFVLAGETPVAPDLRDRLRCLVVYMLRDFRFLNRALVDPFKIYDVDEQGRILRDEAGHYRYSGGITARIAPDGRVRSRFYFAETGRSTSSKPNMQNWGSRREEDYQRILGARYLYATRTIFQAPPGHVLVKADVTSAELWVVAQLSGDPNMIEMIRRAMLPEDDPDFLDPHARRAVQAFRLDCAPTKKALKAAGKGALRTGAKNQLYGYLYGRSDEALVRQCLEEGAAITLEEMRELSAAFEREHPLVVDFMRRARRRPQDPGWIRNPFGRNRRFTWSDDRSIQGELERQAMNFPIQSTVADAISLAMANLVEYRREVGDPDAFRFALQVHDELDFEVPISNLEWFVDTVLPECLERRLPVPVCDLDGEPVPGREPFRFGTGVDVYVNWGEEIPRDRGLELGIPERFLPAPRAA